MAKTLIPSLHAFRGFAIINIVAFHTIEFVLSFAETADEPATSKITPFVWGERILFHDATLYFTFISGLLFSLVLRQRSYSVFFTSKLKNVVLPYIVFSSLMTWLSFGNEGFSVFSGSGQEFVALVSKNIITGGAIFTFWYIPVLIVLYLATPILEKILSIGKAKWLVILIILSPLVFSRVFPEVVWTNFAYFLGAYMLGMTAGRHYQKTIELIQHYIFIVVLTLVASTALLVALFYFEVPNLGIINFLESAWYIQKIALSGLVILLLERSLNRVPTWLDVLSNYAFSIYFLHAFLLYLMYGLMVSVTTAPASIISVLSLSLLNFVLVLLTAVVLTYALKRLLGKHSRSIIGA